jgi:hypothetical protein
MERAHIVRVMAIGEGFLSHDHWETGWERPVTERRHRWQIGRDGQEVKLDRYINRRAKEYYERVEDRLGQILLEKDEPLDQHRAPPRGRKVH